jgi:hypothetical protein
VDAPRHRVRPACPSQIVQGQNAIHVIKLSSANPDCGCLDAHQPVGREHECVW